MKKIFTIVLCVGVLNNSYSQKLFNMKPIYNYNEQDFIITSDTNAFKVGYIPWVLNFDNNKKDTAWLRENLISDPEERKWLFITKDNNEDKWYLYSTPIGDT